MHKDKEKEISPEEVQAAVRKLWTVFTGKAKQVFPDLYFPDASVLSGTGARAEPGRLAVTRRLRKFFDSSAVLSADLGAIEVQILGPNTALATYLYAFQSTETQSDGSRVRRSTPHTRATNIFQRDENGVLRIIHEHVSSATPPVIETLTASKHDYAEHLR
jgi:ketosteroid isomerase-like protein